MHGKRIWSASLSRSPNWIWFLLWRLHWTRCILPSFINMCRFSSKKIIRPLKKQPKKSYLKSKPSTDSFWLNKKLWIFLPTTHSRSNWLTPRSLKMERLLHIRTETWLTCVLDHMCPQLPVWRPLRLWKTHQLIGWVKLPMTVCRESMESLSLLRKNSKSTFTCLKKPRKEITETLVSTSSCLITTYYLLGQLSSILTVPGYITSCRTSSE